MKIGIDAKWYFEGPPSGKRVVRSLVDHLLKSDDRNEYFIILNKKHRGRTFPVKESKNHHLCYVWAGNNLLSNMFLLPFLTYKNDLDALLYQNFTALFGRGKRIAFVYDVLFLSNPEYYTIYERLYFAPLRFLTQKAHAVITISEEEKKRLLHFKLSDDAGKIAVAHPCIDPGFAQREEHPPTVLDEVRLKFGLPPRFLLFVGRLNARKNIGNLLRAIPLLNNKDIQLVIVGADDWKKSNHDQVVKELGIESRILFTGGVGDKQLEIIYSLASVFCFPSYAEGFGLPPLEAMASGVPVVVSNTTSLPEVCGEAGNYVSPDKPEEIAMAIDSLLSNDQLYAEKKRLGLLQVKKFTWERAAQTVLRCIETRTMK